MSIPMVQSLLESGTIQNVPSRFLRPISDRPCEAEVNQVPIIDALNLDSQETLELLDQACKEWGFFQLVGHEIPDWLIHETRSVIKAFFELPQNEKELYSTSKYGLEEGYGRFFVPTDDTVLDWGDVLFHFIPPKRMLWPSKQHRETVEEYGTQMRTLANKLLMAISRALKLKPNFFIDAFGQDPALALRSNFYPPCPEPELVLGISPHSDGTGLTILLQDDVEGLQIKKDGKWNMVSSIPGAFVVNIGDILEIMSNGIYKSVEHRAVVKQSKCRLSVAAFYQPDKNVVLEPLIGDIPLYKSITMQMFVKDYLSGKLNGKEHLQSVKLS